MPILLCVLFFWPKILNRIYLLTRLLQSPISFLHFRSFCSIHKVFLLFQIGKTANWIRNQVTSNMNIPWLAVTSAKSANEGPSLKALVSQWVALSALEKRAAFFVTTWFASLYLEFSADDDDDWPIWHQIIFEIGQLRSCIHHLLYCILCTVLTSVISQQDWYDGYTTYTDISYIVYDICYNDAI